MRFDPRRRFRVLVSFRAAVVAAAVAAVLPLGCGDADQEGMTTSSPEHQEATNKMADFMKSKGKKSGGSAPAAPAPPAAPADSEAPK